MFQILINSNHYILNIQWFHIELCNIHPSAWLCNTEIYFNSET